MDKTGLPILTAIKAPVTACEIDSIGKSIHYDTQSMKYNQRICYRF